MFERKWNFTNIADGHESKEKNIHNEKNIAKKKNVPKELRKIFPNESIGSLSVYFIYSCSLIWWRHGNFQFWAWDCQYSFRKWQQTCSERQISLKMLGDNFFFIVIVPKIDVIHRMLESCLMYILTKLNKLATPVSNLPLLVKGIHF